jgi:hypothetical protein
MRLRRAVVAVAVLAAAVAGAVVPAGAATGTVQAVPLREWHYPGTDNLDGVGGWVYVQPEPPVGAGQLSRSGYVYEEQFFFAGSGAMGSIGLGADAGGPLVGLKLIDRNDGSGPPPLTVRYPWEPGRIYFLLAYGLGGGAWGGWVYDLTAASWTFFGAVQAPSGWGGLAPVSAFTVRGATGMPLPSPFAPETLGTVQRVSACSLFPKADAWFFEPLGWRGTELVSPAFGFGDPGYGDGFPSQTETVNGWFHFGLGTAAPAA